MAKTNYQTVDEYHKAFTGETVARMQAIREIIHEAAPGVEEGISYQIPCFKHNGVAMLYYAAFPKHLTLSYFYSEAFWDHFKADLAGYKTSKSAIQIPGDKPLPEKLIKRIVVFRRKENEAAAKVKKK